MDLAYCTDCPLLELALTGGMPAILCVCFLVCSLVCMLLYSLISLIACEVQFVKFLFVRERNRKSDGAKDSDREHVSVVHFQRLYQFFAPLSQSQRLWNSSLGWSRKAHRSHRAKIWALLLCWTISIPVSCVVCKSLRACVL